MHHKQKRYKEGFMRYFLIIKELFKLLLIGILKMTRLSTPIDALKRAIFLIFSIPAVAWAGIKFDNALVIDQTESFKFAVLILASVAGGISSAFVRTSFDDSVKHPAIFKIFVGSFIGFFAAMAIKEFIDLGFFSVLLLGFFISSLGAPIMSFYLMWISNAETQAEIKEAIKQKVRDKLGVNK